MTELDWKPPTGIYNAARDLADRWAGLESKPAFIDPKRSLSYGALKDQSDRFATALGGLGIGREQRVLMIMLDTIDFPVVFLGAIKAGSVAVPINPLLTNEHWEYMLEDSRAGAVVLSPELVERAKPIIAAIRARRPLAVVIADPSPAGFEGGKALGSLIGSAQPIERAAATHADEVAFWLYTSGSTGKPKAARHVHSSPPATAELYGRRVLGIRSDDVIFSAAKLFFAYGLGNALTFPLSVGATTILMSERPTPDSVLATMKHHQPTIFCGVPTLYAALLAHPDLGPRAGSRRLRTSISAGEALPEEVAKRWNEVVGSEILDGIGSTEMLHIFISNRPNAVRYGSSGKPVPGYQARLVDERGTAVPPGEIGELLVHGPTAAEGYWNNRERSRKTFVGEWTHTGDKYRVDEEGYFYYCGRTDDMFKVSGIWVSPFEVESALVSHPAVLEAAVVGKEDQDGLTKPRAFVVLRPGYTGTESLFEQLRAHVKETAGPWKYPRWIDAVSDLPKTATGKIQRFRLRE